MSDPTVPLYQKVMRALIHQIEVGTLKENDKLPSEQELCRQYDVSRITVRAALAKLQERHYIVKRQGQGSFVLAGDERKDGSKYWEVKGRIREMGTRPSAEIEKFLILADGRREEIKHRMKLDADDYLYEISKVYRSDGKRVMYRHVYLAYDHFPGLKLSELRHGELIPLISRKYNFFDCNYSAKTSAAIVTKDDRRHLDANVNDPEMILDRTGYDGKQLVYLERSRIVGLLPLYLKPVM